MQFQYHANLTLGALRRWLIAQCYDSLMVSALWLAALIWLKVPWAPFWALLAGALQFIPHFGPLLTLLGPAMAMLFSRAPLERWLWLLGAYRGDCHGGWFTASALSDAPAESRAVLGIVADSDRARHRLPVLGSAVGAAPAGRHLCLPWRSKAAEHRLREQQFSSQCEGVIIPPEDHPDGGA